MNTKREEVGELLSAYLDGELDAEATACAEQVLREDQSARELLVRLRQTVDLVQSLPRHEPPGSLADDLQAELERSALLVGWSGEGEESSTRRSPLLAIVSTAAMLAIVAGGLWFMALDDGVSTPGDGRGVKFALVEQLEGGNQAPSAEVDAVSVADHRTARDSDVVAPAEVARTLETSELLASATLKQKFAFGMGLAAASDHRFGNEPLRLRIRAVEVSGARGLSKLLMSRLSKIGVKELGEIKALGVAGAKRDRSFYHQGISHVNFGEGGGTQILVHASRRELDALLREVERSNKSVSEVSLAFGPVVVRGIGAVRDALLELGDSNANRSAGIMEVSRGGEEAASQESLGELAEALGIEPGVLAPLRAEAKTAKNARSRAAGGKVIRKRRTTSLRRVKRERSDRDDVRDWSLSTPEPDNQSHVTLVIEIRDTRNGSPRSSRNGARRLRPRAGDAGKSKAAE